MNHFPGRSISRSPDSISNKEGLKANLDNAQRAIEYQISKLDRMDITLSERDIEMFDRVISGVKNNDLQKATIIANELVEIRKVRRILTTSKISLDQLIIRIGTIKELGEVTITLSSAVSTVKSIKDNMGNIISESENSFEEITGTLSNILTDTYQTGLATLDFKTANKDAIAIIEEAATEAERKLKEELPEIPRELIRNNANLVEA